MIQVRINDDYVDINSPLPQSITDLRIINQRNPFQPDVIPINQSKQIKRWLNNLVDNLTTTSFLYNDTTILTDSIIKFKGL